MDACALIAYLNDEPGADIVESIILDVPVVQIAATNLLEVAYDAVRTTGNPKAAHEIINAILQSPIDIRWNMDASVIEIAARLKTSFRISLADSVALANTVSQSALLATSDHHEFEPLEASGTARILWIR